MSIPNPDPAPTRDPLTGSDQSWGPGKAPPPATPIPPPPPSAKNPNVADTGNRDWPPAASVPSPFTPPPIVELPPPASSHGMSAVPSNSSPLTGASAAVQPAQRVNFVLYDSMGNPVEFQNLTDRRLVVLDFWTTTCMPCLRKIPELVDLQHRYSSYVEIAAVACDDLPFAQRRKAVDGIRDYYLRKSPRPINYGVWFEGDGQEGKLQNQFQVKAYPTLVLLDHNGRELWRGSDIRQLEDAIKYCLSRR
jgi:thiol-disulfide isomerase/thioredoxin